MSIEVYMAMIDAVSTMDIALDRNSFGVAALIAFLLAACVVAWNWSKR